MSERTDDSELRLDGVTYGGIEAGGTKWVCAVGTGPDDVRDLVRFPTTTPDETIGRAAAFFARHDAVAAVGVGSFGPVDLRPGSPTWGHITTTPKAAWADTGVAGALAAALGRPLALDTDVNAAALGELVWGAAQGLGTFTYVTVGTGIGGGSVVGGRLVHGLVHPELGHVRVPHDLELDPFPGVCPYHGDCLEGLASGAALAARWGRPAEALDDERAWRLEADYLALGLVNAICVLSPERVVIGGGVMKHEPLLPLVRGRVEELLGGYLRSDALAPGLEGFVVAPQLGDRSGVLGAFELARRSLAAAD